MTLTSTKRVRAEKGWVIVNKRGYRVHSEEIVVYRTREYAQLDCEPEDGERVIRCTVTYEVEEG